MVHDPALLDRLDALPKEPFEGEVFRATRLNLNPLAASYNGGRWMPRDVAAILYTSLERAGALAEIAFHWSQLNPRPTKPVLVHRLRDGPAKTSCCSRNAWPPARRSNSSTASRSTGSRGARRRD